MFLKQFEIRWSDMDANMHLANSSYINFMSHTRMDFFQSHGLDLKTLNKTQLSPVVFYEHIYYFKEVFQGKPIHVSLEIKGLSADGMFFEFHHNFYDLEGKNFAHCEVMGAWIDFNSRKLTGLPQALLAQLTALKKADGFKILTKEDTRKYVKKPKHLE